MGTPMYLHNSMAACSAVHINGWLLCRYGVGGVVEMWDPLSFSPFRGGRKRGVTLYCTLHSAGALEVYQTLLSNGLRPQS